MTTWTKIEPNVGRAAQRNAFDYPRVTRVDGGSSRIHLPPSFGFAAGEKVDVFHDGGDRIAFIKGGASYTVSSGGRATPTVNVTIPASLAKRLPTGTTRCKLSVIDNGVILDLSQFAPKAAPVARDATNPFAPRAFAAE